MRVRPLSALVLLGLVFAWSSPALAQEPRTELFFSPSGPIGRDESVQLTLRISAKGQVEVSPPSLRFENFRTLSGPNQANSLQFVNGAMSQSISYTWLLRPAGVGKARVLPFAVRINGREVAVNGADADVVENAPPRQDRRAQDPFGRLFGNDPFRDDDDFFNPAARRRPAAPSRPAQILLEATVDDREPWLGEQLIYTLYLLTEVNVRSVTPTEVPDFKGFWNEVIPQPDNAEPQMIERDGRRMGRIALIERALFPRQTGRVEISPVEATMTALLPDPSSFGLMPLQRAVTRQSDRVIVNVRPLPPGAPPGFSGLVGQVSLAATLDRQELEVGEAATFVLELEGKGHLQGISPADLPAIPGLKVFPPQQSGSENLRNRQLVGERVWSYVLVPERPGSYTIPAIEMPYFDPGAGQYKVARSQPLSIQVKGARQTVAPSGATVALHPVRANALPAAAIRPSRLPGTALALAAAPWLLLALVGFWRARRPSGSGELRRRVAQRIADAEAEKRPRPCASILEEAWRTWLEQRHEIAPNVPSSQWRALLTARGVRAADADQLVGLIDDLHYLRYAPELSSTDDLRLDLVERSRRLLQSLG